MEIGERIKVRRLELGMTQEELAKKVGYTSKSTIAKIEVNANQLRQSKIKQIADALNTTTDYIMGWTETQGKYFEIKNEIDSTTLNNEDEKTLIEIFRSVDDNAKRMIMELALYQKAKMENKL